MQTVNLWDSKKFKGSIVLKKIDDIIYYILSGMVHEILLKKSFSPLESPQNILDYDARRYHYLINYTDENHVAVYNYGNLYLYPDFYLENKKIIREAFIKYIKNTDKDVFIPSFLFDDEIFNLVIENHSYITFSQIELTDEQLDALNSKGICAYIEENGELTEITNHFVFPRYTLENLQKYHKVTISLDDLEEIYKNFEYLNCVTDINIDNYNDLDDTDNLLKLKKFLVQLDGLKKRINVQCFGVKRMLFYNLFKDTNFHNIKVMVDISSYVYPYQDFLLEQERLIQMVKDILKADLTPLEKYMAVYNLVKNFKNYKDSDKASEARVLHFILDNEFMVCTGYIELLCALCEIVGISACPFQINVDTTEKKIKGLSNIPFNAKGHMRAMVAMNDCKYHVNGIYISDPTWDNAQTSDYYNHALLTFDKMRMSERLFWFNENYPIMDIHSFKEYNELVNYLLKKAINQRRDMLSYVDIFAYKEIILLSLKAVCYAIINTLRCDRKYEWFKKTFLSCQKEEDYNNLLTNIGYYLLERVNQPLDFDVIISASIEGKDKLKILDEDKEKVKEKVKQKYQERDLNSYPYQYKLDNPHKLWKR